MNLTNTQFNSLLFLLLGVIIVFATSFLKNANWSKKNKHSLAVILSTLTGVVSSYFQKNGTSDLVDIAKHSTYLYTISQLAYTYFISNTSFNQWLTKFNLTSGTKE